MILAALNGFRPSNLTPFQQEEDCVSPLEYHMLN